MRSLIKVIKQLFGRDVGPAEAEELLKNTDSVEDEAARTALEGYNVILEKEGSHEKVDDYMDKAQEEMRKRIFGDENQ